MKADSFFTIGSSHDICQDYAMTYFSGDTAISMISDGCSMICVDGNPVPHHLSDVAARIVCLAAKSAAKQLISRPGRRDISDAFVELINKSLINAKNMFGTSSCLGDATLSIVSYRQGSIPCVTTIGDGVTHYQDDNTNVIITRKYEPNMPAYFSYLIDGDNAYWHKDNIPTLTRVTSFYSREWEFISSDSDTICNSLFTTDNIGLAPEAKSISVFSDGISDITLPSGDKMPVDIVVQTLTSFKRYGGQFVRRRMKAQLRRWASEGIHPCDDTSMATIVME